VGNHRTGIGPLRRVASQREYGVLTLLMLTAAVVSIVNPGFLAAGNIRDLLVKTSPAIIVSCGLTLVIVTGEIDISVGSMMGLLATVMGIVTSPDRFGGAVWLGVVATLSVGTALGFINGLLVTAGRVPSIVVTLGMLTALRGITELLMHGEWIENLPAGLRFFGTGALLGVPVCVATALAVLALSLVLTRQTPLGRRIYAVGSNPRSASLAGISPRLIKIAVFTITGFLTGVATLVSVTQLSVIESGIGVGFELLVITCVVVGGTSISGGRGSVVGSALGVWLLGTVGTALIFLRLGEQSTYWERAIQGAFILLAVLVDHVARRKDRPA
jgi:ribose/xylose/arabinose/galactoside ABC-type transport system permease subunit